MDYPAWRLVTWLSLVGLKVCLLYKLLSHGKQFVAAVETGIYAAQIYRVRVCLCMHKVGKILWQFLPRIQEIISATLLF